LSEHPLITPALSGTVRDHSDLPEPRLLDAAHIFMDADEQVGQPVISNGLPLTKMHHAARRPATSRRENKKGLIQNEINGLPINSLEYIEQPPCNHGR
jgi:predicted restriction endonuclease